MISPIYGYNRPSVEKKEEKQEEVKEREDLEISVEGKSVVDAWLEKKDIHYLISQKDKHQLLLVIESLTSKGSNNMKRIKGRKVSSRSMARENGYEIERQVPLVEEKK